MPQLKYSLITEEKEEKESLGKLFFSLRYSSEKTALIVSVNKCTNLPTTNSAENSRLVIEKAFLNLSHEIRCIMAGALMMA